MRNVVVLQTRDEIQSPQQLLLDLLSRVEKLDSLVIVAVLTEEAAEEEGDDLWVGCSGIPKSDLVYAVRRLQNYVDRVIEPEGEEE